MKNLFTLILICTAFTSWAQKTESRNLSGFTEIKIATSGDFHLKQGNSFKVELKGDDDVLEEIETVVKGNTLSIRKKMQSNGKWNWGNSGSITAYITLPKLEDVTIAGSAKVNTENNFKTDNLDLTISGSGKFEGSVEATNIEIRIAGSGNVILQGKASFVSSHISGSGSVDSENLATKKLEAKIAGSGSCKIEVEESIEARISGSGSVYYKGSPNHVDALTSGSGKVKKL